MGSFDSFEIAKIAGAVLSALLVIVGFRTALEIAEMERAPEKPGYTLPAPEAPAGGAGAEAVPAPVALPAFDAAEVAQAAAEANAQAGAAAFKKCQTCHTVEQGGPNKTGPNLWGIVGRPKASHQGFAYSDALKAKGGDWTPEDLAAFIHNPRQYAAGTRMNFSGIPDATELSDLLAYLSTLK